MILIFCCKVVRDSCHRAYFVAHVFKYLGPNFVSGNLHDTTLQNFCTIKCGTFNCPRDLQLPARLSKYQCILTSLQGVTNLIVSIKWYIPSMHYTKNMANVSKKILFVFTVVYEQYYDKR